MFVQLVRTYIVLLLVCMVTVVYTSPGQHIQDYTETDNVTRSTDDIKGENTKIHLIYMNHLDVGYNAWVGRGFVNFVLNRYFTEFFPRAIRLGKELTDGGYNETFKYTTHPWLVALYMDCPSDFTLSGITLQCPDQTALSDFREAVDLGYITWHAGPMNLQIATMPEWLLDRALNISLELDHMFNISRVTRVLSQRDVPGMTSAAIPTLLHNGVSAVSVGVNCYTSPPAVPPFFRWAYGEEQIIAAWSPGGYPNRAKDSFQKSCSTVDGIPDVLCFAFRTDNTGPPMDVKEILGYYEILRREFPGADIQASTFEDFFIKLEPIKDQLPLVTEELSDTWIQGIASDPIKSAEYRATARLLGQCLESGQCNMSNPRVNRASRMLVMHAEHTWGLDSARDSFLWANEDFFPQMDRVNFVNCTNSWKEQRKFTDITVDALGDLDIAFDIEDELANLRACRPNLKDYQPVSGDPTFSNSLFSLTVGPDGAISRLTFSGTQWADGDSGQTLGHFTYMTFDEEDFDYTDSIYNYSPKGGPGYSKPMPHSVHAISREWPFYRSAAFVHQDDTICDMWIHLTPLEPEGPVYYGAPAEVWIHYSVTVNDTVFSLDVELELFDKTTTRLPEALYFTFKPLIPDNGGQHCWHLSKLGRTIDPYNVVQNGSQYQHALDDGGVYILRDTGDSMQISSPDVPLVCPITDQMTYPTVFPAPIAPITDTITGMGFNIYNNIWNTNYIFWYPYLEEDKDLKSRFKLKIAPKDLFIC